MKVPFSDLRIIHAPLRQDIDAAIKRVVDNNSFIGGPEVKAFEEEFAKYNLGFQTDKAEMYAAGISNGLDGLELALRSCGIGRDDEVIVPVNTFNASAAAIAAVGAIPVFIDCDPDTKLIDLDKIVERIGPKTKAIMPVHLYGQMVPMQRLSSIAKSNNLVVVEDACQAHGVKQYGHSPGSLSDAAAFSFYPGKNLGALGDAGAVISSRKQIINSIKALQNYGQVTKYHHDVLGSNKRLDGIQAAALRVKLPHLDSWNQSRRESASELIDKLNGVGDLKLPVTLQGNTHNYHLFVVETERRDELASYLASNGIDTGIHYPIPLHMQPAFAYLGYKKGDFPVAEKASERSLSLPMFPFMKKDEIEYVADKIKEFYKN